jgi:hypothetical protein
VTRAADLLELEQRIAAVRLPKGGKCRCKDCRETRRLLRWARKFLADQRKKGAK